MLDPQQNRLNFGEIIKPEPDYNLNFAIGTTYSLDLEALLFLPVSLFNGNDWVKDKNITNEILATITQVPDKVMLFCQKGKIKTPAYYSNLLAYWEKSVFEITQSEYDQSFHPKIWLIRYVHQKDKNKKYYKFICTSRNLTHSQDWDTAIVLRADVGKRKLEPNKALSDFISYLGKNSSRPIPKELMDEILYLNFDEDLAGKTVDFFPIINGKNHPLFGTDKHFEKMIVISPFLDKTTFEKYLDLANEVSFFSSSYEFSKLPQDILEDKNTYQFNPSLEKVVRANELSSDDNLDDSAPIADDGVEESFELGQNLHAKLYITQNKNQIDWYIGSANCTRPAYLKNIEFLTQIHGTKSQLSDVDKIKEILLKTEKSNEGIFIPYLPNEKEIEDEHLILEQQLRKINHEISFLEIIGTCIPIENNNYDISLNIDASLLKENSQFSIKFRFLTANKNELSLLDKKQKNYYFKNFHLSELTPYLVFEIYQDSQIVQSFVRSFKIELPEERLRRILSFLIGNKERLMKYLAYLLSKEEIQILGAIDMDMSEASDSRASASLNRTMTDIPLYEKMLHALSRDQESLKQVIKLIDMMKNENGGDGDILEKDLLSLLDTFKNVLTHGN